MGKPSNIIGSDNVTFVNEEKDVEESMSQHSLINLGVKGELEVPTDVQLPMPLLPPISSQKGNEDARGCEVMKSVNELVDLSVAIQVFKSRFDELQQHLDFIEKAIDAKSKVLDQSTNSMQNTASVSPSPSAGVDVQIAAHKNPLSSIVKDDNLDSNSKLKPKIESGDAIGSENELLLLCQTMCSRGLRKYVVAHLSVTAKLREEVPVALRSAPKPSKLVFECIGRFFLQGKKAYNKNSPMIPARQASVLVLEYYLMSGCIQNESNVEPPLKEEASLAAVAWKKRLVLEGGLSVACEIDARGLLLFVACFGIPNSFRNDDIRNLVRLSNPREITHALRQSHVLLTRISDILEGMMKKGAGVDAVDLAYIFGFEEKFCPQTILTQFLQKSEETWKRTKKETHGLATVLKEASEKYLAALKSVVGCLEYHQIDPIKLLPGWQLKEKITNLEKDITEAKRKIEDKALAKKRMDISDSSNKFKIPEPKRSRFAGNDPSLPSSSITVLQDQRRATHMDINSSYNDSLTANCLHGITASHSSHYYTALSVQLGTATGSLSEPVSGGIVVSGAGILEAIPDVGISAALGSTTSSFPGYYGSPLVDNVGTMLNGDGQPYRWHGTRDGEIANERSIGQSSVGQSSSARIKTLIGLSQSAAAFAGLPAHSSIGITSRSGGSDLYSFADSV